MQYMRTPGMARDVVESAGEIPGFNADAAWGLMRTIFATNLGHGFYIQRRTLRLTFLDAPADAEFVSGDQPIVNVRAIGLPEGQPPSESEIALYYPLTPTRALLMAFDAPAPSTDRRSLTSAETAAYNQMIVNASQEQLYARTQEASSLHVDSRSNSNDTLMSEISHDLPMPPPLVVFVPDEEVHDEPVGRASPTRGR